MADHLERLHNSRSDIASIRSLMLVIEMDRARVARGMASHSTAIHSLAERLTDLMLQVADLQTLCERETSETETIDRTELLLDALDAYLALRDAFASSDGSDALGDDGVDHLPCAPVRTWRELTVADAFITQLARLSAWSSATSPEGLDPTTSRRRQEIQAISEALSQALAADGLQLLDADHHRAPRSQPDGRILLVRDRLRRLVRSSREGDHC